LANPDPLGTNEAYVDDLVYEMHPSSDEFTGEDHTFHFALVTSRHKDNRIPPKGFDIANAAARLSVPVYYRNDVDEGEGYFTDAEYSGGYDAVSLTIPGADYVEVNLYYQTTSREYIEFLRDELNGPLDDPDRTSNLTLSGTGPLGAGDPNGPYLAQTDTSGFFDGLKAWGNTIWDLWTHNMNVPGAAPILMAQATWGASPSCVPLDSPVLDPASPASNQVALTWSAVTGAEGYKVYYDQAGKAQLVADAGNTTTYIDTNLTNGNEYCYKVTDYYDCDPDPQIENIIESAFSTISCATPQATGQDTLADVESVLTGSYQTTGKGPNKTTTFTTSGSFQAGDSVVIKVKVVDDSDPTLPVSNASVDIAITGPETVSLTTGPSGSSGYAEVTWSTSTPNRKGTGGTATGSYTATATNVTGGGIVYSAELIPGDPSATFEIQYKHLHNPLPGAANGPPLLFTMRGKHHVPPHPPACRLDPSFCILGGRLIGLVREISRREDTSPSPRSGQRRSHHGGGRPSKDPVDAWQHNEGGRRSRYLAAPHRVGRRVRDARPSPAAGGEKGRLYSLTKNGGPGPGPDPRDARRKGVPGHA